MGLFVVCILAFSHIWQTTQKSELSLFCHAILTDSAHRVLLATIRDKGNCPCLRCHTPKVQFSRLGFLSDIHARLRNIHTYMRESVLAARRMIYSKGVSVKGLAVE